MILDADRERVEAERRKRCAEAQSVYAYTDNTSLSVIPKASTYMSLASPISSATLQTLTPVSNVNSQPVLVSGYSVRYRTRLSEARPIHGQPSFRIYFSFRIDFRQPS